MSTYLKHMGGYKYKQLKGKGFDEIQKLFDKEMKRVNTFVAIGSEVQESNEKKVEGCEETTKGSRKKMLRRKRAGKEQQQESSKKQRMEEDKDPDEVEEVEEDDEAELKKHLVIKKDEDIAIDAIPLAIKPPVIIDYKLHKEDIEDLEALWKLVKTKHGDIRPKDEFERVLRGDLKVMFEPDIRSGIWRNLQGYMVTIWKLIDSSGVHFVRIGINKWYQSFALRNFDLEDMELESTNSGTTAKLPILKLENGDSWVSIPQTTQENGTSVTKMSIPVTAEEKTNKKDDVKARGLLVMALPNEHQLTFSQYLDAKSMFAAIETIFGGNAATKKTQKTLLKQQYENFSTSSGEYLDSIFNRLQKIVSRLAILGVVIAQEDLNLKFLSSLPPEWNTHVIVWMNKPEVETTSIDNLYNNFKIVEQKVKKSVGTSSGAQNLAFMTAPTTSSTNDANTASPQVSAASPNVNAASPQVCTANVSDNTVYAFMVENPNGSNVLQHDLEQLHEDDLEAMDLKWECRAPRRKEGQFRNQDNTRKQGNNKDTSSKAMLAIDGVGFDWSDMTEEQVQKNMALMAFSDSEVYTDKTYSKTCLKNYETLKKQYDDLIVNLNQTEFTTATYKRCLATVEAQLITYRKNEVLFSEEVAVLKREVACKDYEINMLKNQFLGSQITNKSKKGLGYSAVPLPHPLIYNRPKKLDLFYSGLDEFKEHEFKVYGLENKEQVSQDKSSFVKSLLNLDKETVFPVNKKVEFTKPKNGEKPVKKSVRNMPPKVVLLKTGLTPLNTVRPVNTVHPKTTVHSAKSKTNFSKQAQSTAKRPFYNQTALTRRFVLATKRHNYTRRPKAVNTASGYSRHMTGNIAYLSDFKEFNEGYVAFGGGACGGRITGKGTLKTNSLDFEDLPAENQILLKIPRKDNMYSFDMKDIVPKESLTCLVAKATLDESMLWHRRLGHINFKNINKLVKDNLVRGLPTKHFENYQTYVVCLKGKQHRDSCKSKVMNPITKPLFMLHMDFFGLTFVSSLMHKKYCLVVIDDYSRFTWVIFLTTKDETSEILKNFIKEIENLVDKKVKIIRSDNGTEFKNRIMDDFCREKGIKREYSCKT
ncbi:putative ribonuclease H-like domain-containing protein [Tanacetum coccineum]